MAEFCACTVWRTYKRPEEPRPVSERAPEGWGPLYDSASELTAPHWWNRVIPKSPSNSLLYTVGAQTPTKDLRNGAWTLYVGHLIAASDPFYNCQCTRQHVQERPGGTSPYLESATKP